MTAIYTNVGTVDVAKHRKAATVI